VIPKEFTDTLRVLQDRAPQIPYEEVEQQFIDEFGHPPEY
jgi:predicted unusual protein kinase regulating ubiquinone biosynthesis (AarF/ABC1/UbiB family)